MTTRAPLNLLGRTFIETRGHRVANLVRITDEETRIMAGVKYILEAAQQLAVVSREAS